MKILVEFSPLPAGMTGVTFRSDSKPDCYLVICDSTTSSQKRRRSFGHELAHIFLGHFDTAATLDINTAGEAPKVFYQGEEIHKEDPTPLHLNKEPWELEADAAAWSYYHKYKPAFADAEDKGSTVITI